MGVIHELRVLFSFALPNSSLMSCQSPPKWICSHGGQVLHSLADSSLNLKTAPPAHSLCVVAENGIAAHSSRAVAAVMGKVRLDSTWLDHRSFKLSSGFCFKRTTHVNTATITAVERRTLFSS